MNLLHEESAEGWYTDPFGRHEARWMSDGEPTKLVRDAGVESFDEAPDETPSHEAVRIENPNAAPAGDLQRADAAESVGTGDMRRADAAEAVTPYDQEDPVQATLDAFTRSTPP
jgi:hypothetical protein